METICCINAGRRESIAVMDSGHHHD